MPPLTATERALAELVYRLRLALLRVMVEGDDHARAIARQADQAADTALAELPPTCRVWAES